MDKSIFRRFSVLALAALLALSLAAPAAAWETEPPENGAPGGHGLAPTEGVPAAWEETGDMPGASPRPTEDSGDTPGASPRPTGDSGGDPWDNPEIVDPFRWYDDAQMTADLAALAERYPALVSLGSIGQSAEGRDIPLLRLGRGERIVLLCAAIHAREYETTAFVMYMADQYCRGYVSGGTIGGLSCREVLDGVTFVIVPQLNPDGADIARRGEAAAAERPGLADLPIVDAPYEGWHAWKSNARGVDLNRNWPYLWNNQDKCDVPASAEYAGPEPLSEPETKAMMALIESTPFWAFCSLHSAGNCVYWIDSSNPPALYDKLWPTAWRVAAALGYRLMPVEDVSRFGGYMINYCRAAYERPCMTVEIGPYIGHYPFRDWETLRWTAQRALPLGLLLGDEVLKMPAEAGPAAGENDGAPRSSRPTEDDVTAPAEVPAEASPVAADMISEMKKAFPLRGRA